jgi:hypothetical protein
MYILRIEKAPDQDASRDDSRKPWSEPQIVRLRPGSPELERARKALLGDRED